MSLWRGSRASPGSSHHSRQVGALLLLPLQLLLLPLLMLLLPMLPLLLLLLLFQSRPLASYTNHPNHPTN